MSFEPPAASKGQLQGIDFGTAVPIAAKLKAVFDADDQRPGNQRSQSVQSATAIPYRSGVLELEDGDRRRWPGRRSRKVERKPARPERWSGWYVLQFSGGASGHFLGGSSIRSRAGRRVPR